jgi:hypothetical protein
MTSSLQGKWTVRARRFLIVAVVLPQPIDLNRNFPGFQHRFAQLSMAD